MLKRTALLLSVSILALSGCSRLAISNNSLAYKQAVVLPPLQLPAGDTTRPMNAIYPAPQIDPNMKQAAPVFANKKGNRFDMPLPQELVNPLTGGDASNVGVGAPAKPELQTDGSGYPLLKVEGDPNRIWDLLGASLSAANIKVIDRNQSSGTIQIKLGGQKKPAILSLIRSGAATTITVQDDKHILIDKNVATDVLTQINQNWPA
jgi:uncharacterized lipoprotein